MTVVERSRYIIDLLSGWTRRSFVQGRCHLLTKNHVLLTRSVSPCVHGSSLTQSPPRLSPIRRADPPRLTISRSHADPLERLVRIVGRLHHDEPQRRFCARPKGAVSSSLFDGVPSALGQPEVPALAREAFHSRICAPSVHCANLFPKLVPSSRGGWAHPDKERHDHLLSHAPRQTAPLLTTNLQHSRFLVCQVDHRGSVS